MVKVIVHLQEDLRASRLQPAKASSAKRDFQNTLCKAGFPTNCAGYCTNFVSYLKVKRKA